MSSTSDRDREWSLVQPVLSDLVAYWRPDLDELLSSDLVSETEYRSLRELSSPNRCKTLLEILPGKGKGTFDAFLAVLERNDSEESKLIAEAVREASKCPLQVHDDSESKTSEISQKDPYSSYEDSEEAADVICRLRQDFSRCGLESRLVWDQDGYDSSEDSDLWEREWDSERELDPRWDSVVRPILPKLVDAWVPNLEKIFWQRLVTPREYVYLRTLSRLEQCRTLLVELLPEKLGRKVYNKLFTMLNEQPTVARMFNFYRHPWEFETSDRDSLREKKMDRNPRWEHVQPLLSDIVWLPCLDHLFASHLISNKEYKLLRKLSPSEQSKALLINILPQKGLRSYERFLKVLSDAEGQESVVVKMLRKREEEHNDKRWLLIREPLFSEVVANWRHSHKLYDRLYEIGLISSKERSTLSSFRRRMPPRAECQKLLIDILPKKGPSSFDLFLSILTHHNTDVWTILNSAVEVAYYVSRAEENVDATAPATAAKAASLQGEEFSASFSLQWREMTLKFTRTQTVEEDVDELGSKIECYGFSLTIPPGAVEGSAVRLGFTVYEYQPEASEGVGDDCFITDILVLHPCGFRFAKDVAITFNTSICNTSESATLLYETQETGLFMPLSLKAPQSTLCEITVKLCLPFVDIYTKHFCKSIFAFFGGAGHCYRALAFGRWTKGESLRVIKTATIDLYFTSTKYTDLVERCNKGMSELLNRNATIYFPKKGRFTLVVNRTFSDWKLESSASMSIEKQELREAIKNSSKFCKRTFKLKKMVTDAEGPGLEVCLTAGKKTNCTFTLNESLHHDKTSPPASEATVAKVSLVQSEMSENFSPSKSTQKSRSSSVSSIESNRENSFCYTNALDEDVKHTTESVLLNPPTKNVVLINVNGQRMSCIQKATASKRIKEEGGSLAMQSYGISLTIPPGAITARASLDVTLSLYVSDEAMNLEGRTAHVGLIELLPHETAFTKRVILRYKLRHHYKPGDDCIETEYGLFYGKGIDPSETYDFIGSLGTERFQSRHISYKGTMDVHLRDDCLELSTKTFCRFCPIVAIGSFKVAVGFFVRPKGVYKGKRGWDIRITISCTCSENLEKIEKELQAGKYRLDEKKRLRCKSLSFKGSQRLEFSLSRDDDFTSENFTFRPPREFRGEDLPSVVENDDPIPSFLERNCTIKCSEETICTQPVTFVYRYYESLPRLREDLISCDDVPVLLEKDVLFDSRNTSEMSQTAKSNGVDESVSSRNASSKAESYSFETLKVQACESSLSHTNDQRNGTELLYLKRKPTKEELRDVAARIVKEWKHVARALSVDENEIERIDSNYKDVKEQAYQMLLHWMESKSESATIERLCQALRGERKNKTVTDVFGNVPD